nr:MAG: hypothetical protein A3K83_07855 [Omnitrophica WOR_2 bacterium RBG_13_44_8b]
MNPNPPDKSTFEGYSIISCGTLRPELNYLKETGFLNADKILYTAPGLHEIPWELEKQHAVGIYEKYSNDLPERILEFTDWMRLNIHPYRILLDRLRHALLNEIL